MVEAGCLASYGVERPEMYAMLATYVDKIFKGADPAELPVQQPTKLDLVINVRTASALGLPIPSSLLLAGLIVPLAHRGLVGGAFPGGTFSLGGADFHPLVLVFAASGSLMISKTIHIPKP